jgi:UDP-N-acetyl-D-galactosamine dehydrogenase
MMVNLDDMAELADYGVRVVLHDPLADPDEARCYCGIELQRLEVNEGVDGVIIAVIHADYREMGLKKIVTLGNDDAPLILDVKGGFSAGEAAAMKMRYGRL